MNKIFQKHKLLWPNKSFVLQVLFGFALLAASLIATYYANYYTAIRASNAVTDILLDNIPVVNVNFVFNEGALIFLAIVTAVLLYEPRRIPFVLKSAALFTLTRSLFMVMTHLAPPTVQSYIDTTDIFHKISSGDDLFFSAHTGLPFLLAIIFWKEGFLKYFFLLAAAIGGMSVLFGHLHYSIDVFSALFISFGIFHISKKIFPKDYLLFGKT
jgi:hypothetical protein